MHDFLNACHTPRKDYSWNKILAVIEKYLSLVNNLLRIVNSQVTNYTDNKQTQIKKLAIVKRIFSSAYAI